MFIFFYAEAENVFVPLDAEPTVFSVDNAKEFEADYWRNNAQDYLKSVLEDPEKEVKPKKAKNIILFLGDGMSLATVAATRMYMYGNEKSSLSFEKFAHFGLSKVRTKK